MRWLNKYCQNDYKWRGDTQHRWSFLLLNIFGNFLWFVYSWAPILVISDLLLPFICLDIILLINYTVIIITECHYSADHEVSRIEINIKINSIFSTIFQHFLVQFPRPNYSQTCQSCYLATICTCTHIYRVPTPNLESLKTLETTRTFWRSWMHLEFHKISKKLSLNFKTSF